MKRLLLSATLLSIATVAGASGVNLVQNGSFEQPLQAEGTWKIYYDGDVPGWSSDYKGEDNGVEIRNSVVGEAYHGQNFVELDTNHAPSGNSTIWQAIHTTAGQWYELTFAYSPRIQQPISTNGISVFWNYQELQAIKQQGDYSNPLQNLWGLYTFSVLGTGSDVLRFTAFGTEDSLGGNIDDVRLSAVPLPAAGWLFGSALVGFVMLSNRRKI